MTERVLVTGGSGFVAGHCILALLTAGYEVRATVRSLDREPTVRATLTEAGMAADAPLTFVAADLLADDGWAEAMAGCAYVLHVASPVVPGHVTDETTVIRPAKEGTLRVLRAARDAGVRRLVLTSAFHAVGFGYRRRHSPFTEEDWSVLDGPGVDAYGRSKILAERAAWDFAAAEGGALELTTLLPVAIMGPVLGADVTGANHLVQRILTGGMPGYPRMAIPIVDVRDVATAHVAALTADGATGQRILVATGEPAMPMAEIGAILREEFGEAASRVPTRRIPDLVVRAGALINPEFRSVAVELGVVKRISIDKARRLFSLQPRPAREAILAAGRSLIDIEGGARRR